MYEEFPDLLTVDHVAEMLSMTRRAVYAAADRGTIKGKVPLGPRNIRFLKADVLASLDPQARVPRKRKKE